MFRQLLIAALVGLALAAPSDKVDGKLRSVLSSQGKANVVVSFTQTNAAVLNRINGMRFESRVAKINTMKAQLEELTVSSQKNALSILSSSSATFTSLWIVNRIYITDATPEIVASIAALPEVAEVREEFVATIDPVVQGDTIMAEWGIDKIEAEQAWALPGGNNGAGVVVATIDTGARHTHEALRNNYRSDYGWFDPYDGNALPMDANGHGTHVVGTIAGSGGIGVAPGAQWIACRGCSTASCSEAALTRCGQWVVCPTLANGQSPDCTKAPTLSSNSWGGGGGQTWFDAVIESWHTADIIPLFSIGNSGGSGCGTAGSPGDSRRVIACGSTTVADAIAASSSRGPAQNGAIKPDVSAPGANIRSAWSTSDTAYNTISGTSMATPHVSGTVALLRSQNPNMSYTQIKNLLEAQTDRNLGQAATCGGTPYDQFPNNIYGWGRINARKTLAAAISN